MRTYKVGWDTSGEEVDLPETVEVPSDIDPDEAADYISDEYGWGITDLELLI